MATVIVGLVLAIIVGLIVRGMVRNHRSGKTSCSCGGNCEHCKGCH